MRVHLNPHSERVIRAKENIKVYCTVFLEVAQTFDKLWHEGLIYELNMLLLRQFRELLESSLPEIYFKIIQEEFRPRSNSR